MSNPINVTIQANQVHLSEESTNVEHAARISQMNSLESELKGLITAEESRALGVEGNLDTKIDTAVANLVDGAPEVLNTLKELSDALGGDENAAVTLTGKVTAEQQRAEDAERVLREDLAAEVQRAQNEEATLLKHTNGVHTGKLESEDIEIKPSKHLYFGDKWRINGSSDGTQLLFQFNSSTTTTPNWVTAVPFITQLAD